MAEGPGQSSHIEYTERRMCVGDKSAVVGSLPCSLPREGLKYASTRSRAPDRLVHKS